MQCGTNLNLCNGNCSCGKGVRGTGKGKHDMMWSGWQDWLVFFHFKVGFISLLSWFYFTSKLVLFHFKVGFISLQSWLCFISRAKVRHRRWHRMTAARYSDSDISPSSWSNSHWELSAYTGKVYVERLLQITRCDLGWRIGFQVSYNQLYLPITIHTYNQLYLPRSII